MGILDWFVGRKIPEPPPTESVSVPGTATYGGRPASDEISPEWANPVTRFKRQKEIAYNTDIVSAGMSAFLRLVSGVEWSASPPKNLMGGSAADAKLYAELTVEMMHDMSSPWSAVTVDSALSPFIGYAMQSTQGKLRPDGLLGLENLWTIPQNTVDQWLLDPAGLITGIVQKSPADGYVEHVIPRNRVAYFKHKFISDAPEGTGLLRFCAKTATMIEEYLDLELAGFQNDLRGTPVMYVPEAELKARVGKTLSGGTTKVTQSDVDAALAGARDLAAGKLRKNGQGLTVDSEVYVDTHKNPTAVRKWEVQLLQGSGGASEVAGLAIDRLTRSLARILGVEHMLLGGDGSGSLALGREKILMFKLLVDATLSNMAWVYRHDVVKAFIFARNGWDPRLVPLLQPRAVQLKDVMLALQVVEGLARAGFTARPGDKAPDVIREMVDLPPMPEEDPDADLLEPGDDDEEDLLGGDEDDDPDGDQGDETDDPDEGNAGDGHDEPAPEGKALKRMPSILAGELLPAPAVQYEQAPGRPFDLSRFATMMFRLELGGRVVASGPARGGADGLAKAQLRKGQTDRPGDYTVTFVGVDARGRAHTLSSARVRIR